MCKIEIGGNGQSTDGVEPSYKHFREEAPACGVNRGYEMWLLSEAYKRNPEIKSYLLSWGVPRWVGKAASEAASIRKWWPDWITNSSRGCPPMTVSGSSMMDWARSPAGTSTEQRMILLATRIVRVVVPIRWG
jgi:galactosylceramidase